MYFNLNVINKFFYLRKKWMLLLLYILPVSHTLKHKHDTYTHKDTYPPHIPTTTHTITQTHLNVTRWNRFLQKRGRRKVHENSTIQFMYTNLNYYQFIHNIWVLLLHWQYSKKHYSTIYVSTSIDLHTASGVPHSQFTWFKV